MQIDNVQLSIGKIISWWNYYSIELKWPVVCIGSTQDTIITVYRRNTYNTGRNSEEYYVCKICTSYFNKNIPVRFSSYKWNLFNNISVIDVTFTSMIKARDMSNQFQKMWTEPRGSQLKCLFGSFFYILYVAEECGYLFAKHCVEVSTLVSGNSISCIRTGKWSEFRLQICDDTFLQYVLFKLPHNKIFSSCVWTAIWWYFRMI